MSKALPRKLIHAKVTVGGIPMTYTFSCKVDQKEASIVYLYQKDEQTGKTVTLGSQAWVFKNMSIYYELVRHGYKSDYLPNLCFNLFQACQIASSNELMHIATTAINNAVAEKEKANAESAKEASDVAVEAAKPKRKRTSKKKSDDRKK